MFVPSATGVGSAGTACAGHTFTIILLDPATGRYRFVPDSPVVLGHGDVGGEVHHPLHRRRGPRATKDSNPAQPGLQTNQYATVALMDITPGLTFGQTGSATGIDQTTVLQAAPQIATQVNDASIMLGETFTDTATVTGPPGAPTPTGTVNFFVYGPNDATCAGPGVPSSLNPPLTGGAATSDTYSPGAGTYRVIAVYSGDANYAPTSGACNDPNETVVVEAPPPPPTPTTREQCMNGGWRTYGVFKNQGDCVSFVATKGKNPPAGPKK